MDPILQNSTEGETSRVDPAEPEAYPAFVGDPDKSRAGHSVTFAGLYLFTLFVFFRPYELFDALTWTSSFALFFAVFSLLAYTPIQLSVEGTLTFRSREVNLAFLLLLTAVISIPMSLSPIRGIYATIEFAKVIVVFILLVNTVRTRNRLWWLIWLALLSGCLTSIVAVHDYITGNLTLRGARIQGAIGGMFSNPNDLALHLVMMAPIAASLFFVTRNRAAKPIYIALAGLFVFGIVATLSRGGFLGLIVVTGVFIWKGFRGNRLLVISTALCLAFAAVAFVPADYVERLTTTSDDSARARQDELKRSLLLMLRHPIVGLGIDNYILYSNNEHATHNAYTQVGADLGVIAMLLYIMLLVTTLKRIRRMQKVFEETDNRRAWWFSVGLEASLIGYMITSFFLSVAFLWYVYYLIGYSVCFDRIAGLKSGSLAEISTAQASEDSE